MAVYVQACQEANYDAVTGTCTAPYYTELPSAIPTLTIEDAQAIGLSMAMLLATAWCFRRVGKAITRIG